MTTAPARSSRARRAGPAAVLLGAVLVATGVLLRWWTVQWQRPVLGPTTTGVTGREAAPVLLVLAGAAVAGWVATLAARGRLLRLVLTVLVVLLGVLAVVVAVTTAAGSPAGVVTEAHPEAERVLPASPALAGPALVVLGGVLVALGGLLLLGAARRRTGGLPGRFERGAPVPASPGAAAPAGTRESAARGPATAAPADPADTDADAAALLWKQLDAGQDPTAADGPDEPGPVAGAARRPSAGRYHEHHTEGPIGDAPSRKPPPQAGDET